MADMPRLDVYRTMLDTGVIPVFHHPDPETARGMVEACARAGAKVVEFTHRADFAQEVFADLVRHVRSRGLGVTLGVGSIVEEGTAAMYLNLGANFVVGPCLNPAVAKVCNRRKVAYMPGCATVSEISQAEELGVEICKVFPGGEVGGPEFIRSVLGPMPWVRLMPTGGVDNSWESLSSWFGAGVACVGMGSKLISKDDLKKRDFQAVEDKAKQAVAWARKARGHG